MSQNSLVDEKKEEPIKRAPAIFLGHGNPMNALIPNQATRKIASLGEFLQKPKAVIVISAHWQTYTSKILKKEHPDTIYDFSGFPPQLYQIKYPASGAPDLVQDIYEQLHTKQPVFIDEEWGFDHGAWSVLVHLFPKADVPIIMLSLDKKKSLEEHYTLAKSLSALRDQGYMILGTGNIVHNLWFSDWLNKEAAPTPWAVEFNEKIKHALLTHDVEHLVHINRQHGSADKLAVPTLEHYLPLIYTIGSCDGPEQAQIINDSFEHGTISMLSIAFGLDKGGK